MNFYLYSFRDFLDELVSERPRSGKEIVLKIKTKTKTKTKYNNFDPDDCDKKNNYNNVTSLEYLNSDEENTGRRFLKLESEDNNTFKVNNFLSIKHIN